MTTPEPTRYLLRCLNTSEIDPVATAGLINRAFGRHEILVGDRTTPEGLFEESGPDAEFLQVFTEEGVLLASLMMRTPPADEGPFTDAEHSLYLGLAAVEDGFTRVGFGRRLVREAERIARCRGFRRVVLGAVREFDLVPYYERQGYSVVHTREFDADHWSITLLHHYCEMEKALTPWFRTAEGADVPRVTEIINAAYRVEDFFINGNRTNEAEIAELVANGEIVVLIDDAGIVSGAVHLTCHGSHGYFGMLSIDPARQQSGWGTLMIDMCEQRSSELGCVAMDLHVVNLREGLPDWYRRLGYTVDGTLPFPDPARLSQPAHMVTMTKPLPRASEGKAIWR